MEDIKERPPKGIIFLTVLSIISGLILIICFFVFIALYSSNQTESLTTLSVDGFLLVFGLAEIIISIGLYKGKRWSWTHILVLYGTGSAGFVWGIINGNNISIAGLVISIMIIYYLYRPNVRRFFSKK